MAFATGNRKPRRQTRVLLTSSLPPLAYGGKAANRGYMTPKAIHDLQDVSDSMEALGYELACTFFIVHIRRRVPYTKLPMASGFKTATRPAVPSRIARGCPQCHGAALTVCDLCCALQVMFMVCGAVVGCPDICSAPAYVRTLEKLSELVYREFISQSEVRKPKASGDPMSEDVATKCDPAFDDHAYNGPGTLAIVDGLRSFEGQERLAIVSKEVRARMFTLAAAKINPAELKAAIAEEDDPDAPDCLPDKRSAVETEEPKKRSRVKSPSSRSVVADRVLTCKDAEDFVDAKVNHVPHKSYYFVTKQQLKDVCPEIADVKLDSILKQRRESECLSLLRNPAFASSAVGRGGGGESPAGLPLGSAKVSSSVQIATLKLKIDRVRLHQETPTVKDIADMCKIEEQARSQAFHIRLLASQYLWDAVECCKSTGRNDVVQVFKQTLESSPGSSSDRRRFNAALTLGAIASMAPNVAFLDMNRYPEVWWNHSAADVKRLMIEERLKDPDKFSAVWCAQTEASTAKPSSAAAAAAACCDS